MTDGKRQKGRPKLSVLEKSKSRAARDYRAYLHTFGSEFDDEIERKRVQFYESDEQMGRPPLSLKQHQEKARTVWDGSWTAYVKQCEVDSVEPESPKDLEKHKARDKAGRRGNDRIVYLLKYARQQKRKAENAEAVPDLDYNESLKNTRGRVPMTKLEKVAHYNQKAKSAELEIVELIANLPKSEQLYYKIHDFKIERRQTLMCITNPGNPQALTMALSAEQATQNIMELDTAIGALEVERHEAIKKETPKKSKPKKMTPNEISEKARAILSNAHENASDEMRTQADQDLKEMQDKSKRLDELLNKARADRLRKRIQEQEQELIEMGIDPAKVMNG
ncbi:hypothetical protein SAMN04488490_0885 [Marinobacter sp. LV10R510-11A]|nr:hypothetical protein SAMN04488490_0885 [Marinobacter sp. LV10R510-11A]